MEKFVKKYWFFIGPMVVTAIFSLGFMHPDEHYQILELVNSKWSDRYQNPNIFQWDFHLMMRSWLQPLIYWLILTPLKFLGPFLSATVIRLLSGALGLGALYYFIKDRFPAKADHILFLLGVTWFVPFLLVRTSSESLSLSLFLWGVFFFRRQKWCWSAFLWGLMFLVRFQMATLVAPFMLISLAKKRLELSSFMLILTVILVVIGGGVLVDYWGYGKWTVSFYNYFYENIIAGKSAAFGKEPVWYYLVKPLLKGIPPISLTLFAGAILFWRQEKKETMLWSAAIFVVINSLISHKEVRFLTPVYFIVAIYAYAYICDLVSFRKWRNVFIGLNILIMMKTSLGPAHSRIKLYEVVANRSENTYYLLDGAGKFEFTMPFYMNRKIETKYRDESTQKPYVLLTTNFKEYSIAKKINQCSSLYSQYPGWIEKVNFGNWLKRSSFSTLWVCS